MSERCEQSMLPCQSGAAVVRVATQRSGLCQYCLLSGSAGVRGYGRLLIVECESQHPSKVKRY